MQSLSTHLYPLDAFCQKDGIGVGVAFFALPELVHVGARVADFINVRRVLKELD